jgi:hypothetical protein
MKPLIIALILCAGGCVGIKQREYHRGFIDGVKSSNAHTLYWLKSDMKIEDIKFLIKGSEEALLSDPDFIKLGEKK